MNRDVATKCRAGPECTWEVSVLDMHNTFCYACGSSCGEALSQLAWEVPHDSEVCS